MSVEIKISEGDILLLSEDEKEITACAQLLQMQVPDSEFTDIEKIDNIFRIVGHLKEEG